MQQPPAPHLAPGGLADHPVLLVDHVQELVAGVDPDLPSPPCRPGKPTRSLIDTVKLDCHAVPMEEPRWTLDELVASIDRWPFVPDGVEIFRRWQAGDF